MHWVQRISRSTANRDSANAQQMLGTEQGPNFRDLMNRFSERWQTATKISRRRCMERLLGMSLLGIGSTAFCGEPQVRHGKVLLVRGVLSVFSLGLDDLAARLTQQGCDAEVVPACMSSWAVDEICAKYATGQLRGPLVLIGHSLGGDLLPGMADRLAWNRRSVDLVVMVDATFPSPCPSNVRRCVNIYQSNFSPEWLRVFRGAPIRASNPATKLVNVDIRKLTDHPDAATLDHFNIEASPWIHQLIMNEVKGVMEQPVEQAVQSSSPPATSWRSVEIPRVGRTTEAPDPRSHVRHTIPLRGDQ